MLHPLQLVTFQIPKATVKLVSFILEGVLPFMRHSIFNSVSLGVQSWYLFFMDFY